MRPLSRQERRFLAGLTPHTRAHALQLLNLHPLLRITSGRRTILGNKRAGGATRSFHLRGRAVDFVGPAWDLGKAAGNAWALRIGSACTGPEEVLLEDLGKANQHLHVAW
jgi:uncharacterized protein YcbK (DUF882 family)